MTGRICCNRLEEIFLENITGEGPSNSLIADCNGLENAIGVVEGDKVGEGV